jgi:plasmid stabilization system protein ParE
VKVTFHADALAEYADAVAWYERDYPGRGERFAAAVEKVLEAIAGQPDTFATRLGVRAATVHRFPYVVFFARPEPETVRVLAIAHAKRRPKYWRGRR